MNVGSDSLYGNFKIPCEECGKAAVFFDYNDEKGVEEYECDEGHITEKPMLENGELKD